MKSFTASLLLISMATSGVALAAPASEATVQNQIQPYVTATGGVQTIALGTPKTKIVDDTFVAAPVQVPASSAKKIVAHAPAVVARAMLVTTTGYNSEEAQTDSSPFIAADGSHVYWGMVAANFLPFGTKIKIPEYYGDKVFVVHDRMNKRYWERVDVWFPEHSQAVNWGRRTIRIEILES